jgi:Ca-activated chloride channel family protein
MASAWDDLWQRRDQQADMALQAGDLERARQLAETPLRKGEAAYRAGDYASALSSFSANTSPQGHYNRGNALAQLGRYEEAVAAYDDALNVNPKMVDAAHNKAEVEKFLEQQQQQPQNDENSQSPNSDQTESGQADNSQSGDINDEQNGSKQAENNPEEQASPENGTEAEQNTQQQAGNNEDTDNPADEANTADQQTKPGSGSDEPVVADAQQDTTDLEQQQADERWLRRVPDDPGGLLRRKFLYQYSQRGVQRDSATNQDW